MVIVLALCRDKTIQDREPIFCRKVSILKFFLTWFHITPLTIVLFLNCYTSKILIFTLLQICQKCPKNARYEKSTIKLVLKSFQTYAENIFMNIIFPKIDPFVYVSTKHNSHISKNNFLVTETHLKTGIPENDSP